MEHLDRLKTYKEVRETVVTLCHNIDDADIGNVDDANESRDSWEGWWQDDLGWHEPEVPGGLHPAGDDHLGEEECGSIFDNGSKIGSLPDSEGDYWIHDRAA